jgi:hypothetical protein
MRKEKEVRSGVCSPHPGLVSVCHKPLVFGAESQGEQQPLSHTVLSNRGLDLKSLIFFLWVVSKAGKSDFEVTRCFHTYFYDQISKLSCQPVAINELPFTPFINTGVFWIFWWYWGLNSEPTLWATLPALFRDRFFQGGGVSQTICPGWLRTVILLISAS